jgi:LacI family transcriptional regulator
MANIFEVAQRAQVSIATVSHVINNTRFVSEETKARVLDAMEQLSYTPNSVAQSLRSQKTKTIGLLIPILDDETSNIFFMRVAQGVEYVLKQKGYHLMLSNTNGVLDDEIEQIRHFNNRQIDGLIVAPAAGDQSGIHELVGDKYPVVFIDRKPEGIDGDFVLNDGFTGSYEAVSMLIKKGHRKIGILSGLLNLSPAADRYEGYRKALNDHGVAIDESIMLVGESSYDSGYAMAQKILTEARNVTALFIASNAISMGVIGFIQDKGLKVPEDIAIIGFDNYEWTKVSNPPLSVINQSSYELGVKAAEVLMKKVKKPSDHYREYRLPTNIIIRKSF